MLQLRKITILVTISTSLFFSGCFNKKDPTPQEVVYIKAKVPKQKYLRRVKPYVVTDVIEYKDRLCLKRKDIQEAAKTAKVLRKQNYFYRRQVVSFNKKIATQTTKNTQNTQTKK